jgi:hypothetical protein
MTHLRHLVAHDVRQHWQLLTAWIAIVVAHPVLAAVSWSEDALASAMVLAAGLVGARVVIGAAVIATVVQADSPIDDRAFWRTRPISPATMAGAKLTLACLVFVLVPLLVVLSVAAALQLPARHWPATVLAVVLGEVPLVMLVVVVASRTRRSSTALVGLVGVLMLLLLIAVIVGQVVIQVEPTVRHFDPFAAPLALALWTVACLSVLATAAWWGTRARAVLLIGSAVGVLGLLALWLVPTVRSARSTLAATGIAPVLIRLDARRVAGSRVRLAAVVSHAVSADTNLMMENVTIAIGDRIARLPVVRPTVVQPGSPSERAFTVAHLSEDDALALRGQPVRITGQLVIWSSRRTTDAQAMLMAGARLDGARVRGLIEQVYRPTQDEPVVADVTLLSPGPAMGLLRASPRLATSLRDVQTQQRHQLTNAPRKTDALVSLVRLPVVARPFAVQRLSLRARGDERATIVPEASRLEVDIVDVSTSFAEVTATLSVPALTAEARP